MTWMRPAEALRPNRVPCGPRSHLDPLDLAELVEADAAARAVDAVDEHRDRAFQARIVADRADAADAGRAVGLGAGRGDEQRRGELVQRADVGGAAILHRLAADRGDRERDVLQRLPPALGGDDDLGVVGRVGGRIGRLRGVGRRGGAGGIVLRVRIGRRGKRGDPRGQQPIFLHLTPPREFMACLARKANVNGNHSPAEKPRFPVGLGRSLQFRNRTVSSCNGSRPLPLRKARFSVGRAESAWAPSGSRDGPEPRWSGLDHPLSPAKAVISGPEVRDVSARRRPSPERRVRLISGRAPSASAGLPCADAARPWRSRRRRPGPAGAAACRARHGRARGRGSAA